MIEDKFNHAKCSVNDGWKEFDRSGEISNAAENVLNSASWLIGEVERLQADKAGLVEHLDNLIKEAAHLAEFKNDTLRNGICSTDMDEPEWHDYQTIGEAAEYLGKLPQKHKGDSDV